MHILFFLLLSTNSFFTCWRSKKNSIAMGDFVFPEFRRRISSSLSWIDNSQSLCEASALAEANQVLEKLGGVKLVEQSFCNQEISQNEPVQQNQKRGFSLFSTFQKPVLGSNQQKCTSISEMVVSKELSANTNPASKLGTSAPSK